MGSEGAPLVLLLGILVFGLGFFIYDDVQEHKKRQEWVMDHCSYAGQMPYIYIQKGQDIKGIRTFYDCPDGTREHYDVRGEW